MWNIRSHARRFPVHTGTLTPSIAHPNRFLNHLKLFFAGFLTFRGGKIKNCTVSGDKTNDFECAARLLCASSAEELFLFWSNRTPAGAQLLHFHGRGRNGKQQMPRLLPLEAAVRREGLAYAVEPSPSRLTACQLPRRGSLFVANRQILKSSPFGGAGKPTGFD